MTDFLNAVEIDGYKCFEQLRVPLAPLTLLSGFNGAGKSTALQPLLLLAQAARLGIWGSGRPGGQLPLNGDLVRLGSAGDVLRAGSDDSGTRFRLGMGATAIDVRVRAKAGERVLRATDALVPPEAGAIVDCLTRLVHLSAVRGGPSDAFPMPDRAIEQVADVGVDGRFASFWYHELADTEVPAGRCRGDGNTFRRQVDEWLDCLAPGASANVQSASVASAMALQFRLSGTSEWRRPANVGYGLTYSFPILVALLAARAGDIVVIDSPEAHLHPRAQSRMGRMLATFAASGVQILVETHSDHVLNGARIAVRDGVISHRDVGVLFFAGAGGDGHGVTSPRIDHEGRIDHWPDGFFDQNEKDVSRLVGWD